jgi:putative hydrolase of the HAD superfamily
LLLLDLDNTLIDRQSAFLAATTEFLAGYQLPATDLTWVADVDGGGYTPRPVVADRMIARYTDRVDADTITGFVNAGGAGEVRLDPAVRRALARAGAYGWARVIVTNGRTATQEAKIRTAGLDRVVDGWVISQTAGHHKPEPAMFQAAADTVGGSLSGAWMIGDSIDDDILGAAAIGLRTVWVSAGRAWPAHQPPPTRIAATTADAIVSATGSMPMSPVEADFFPT